MEKQIKIKYDYVPKYYQTRMIQGHREEQCFVVHPEFYPKKPKQVERKENDRTEKNSIARRTTVEESTKVGNKDKRSKFKDGTMDNEQAEGYINTGKINVAKPGDIVDSSQ